MHTINEQWIAGWAVVMIGAATACAGDVQDAEAIGGTAQALSTVIDIDFSSYPVGPLGSPWTVSASGSGKANIVSTSDHGKILTLSHGAERDFTTSTLPLSYSGSSFEFEFAVKPKTSQSAFTVTLSSPKAGYKTPRFAVGFSRFSPDLTVESAATNGNGTCGPLAPGMWSVVNLKLRPEDTRHVVDVRVNGAITAACTGVATSLRNATVLALMDNLQPSANAETSFDDFFLQAGNDGEL
jgi:hypothetical protein